MSNAKVPTTMFSGGGTALPANPFTYITISIDGIVYKIPAYNS